MCVCTCVCDGNAFHGNAAAADVSWFSPNGRCLCFVTGYELGAGVSGETKLP